MAISSETSRPTGRNGTTAIVMPCGASGRAMTASSESLHCVSPGRATFFSIRGGARRRALISLPPTTDSRCATSSVTTTSTIRRTTRTTGTEPIRTPAGTAESRGQRTIRRSANCVHGKGATFWRPSQGTPMLLAGDEIGRTQRGNNNAYCQDKEFNWIDWQDPGAGKEKLRDFVRKLIKL